MIDRQGNRIVIECDSCEETISGEEQELWQDFWPRAKREGWTVRKVGQEWVHGCPRCGT